MKFCFQASNSPKSQESLEILKSIYDHHPLGSADVVVALGGDGFMIETIHKLLDTNIPIYGMNRGTVGFLLNCYRKNALEKRISDAVNINLCPLKISVKTSDKEKHTLYAINEVALLRHTSQAANIKISVDDVTVIDRMVADGIMVATPAGSTAYNSSAYGPILPLGSNVLAVTPISPFCPKRWRGALIPNTSKVCFKTLQPTKRPINITADFHHINDVTDVSVIRDTTKSCTLLFDANHNLEQRITKEQFS